MKFKTTRTWRGSGSGTFGSRHCFSQMMSWFLVPLGRNLQHTRMRFAAAWGTSKFKAVIPAWRTGALLHPGQGLKWRSWSTLGSCSQVNGKWSVQLTGGSRSHTEYVADCCGKYRTEPFLPPGMSHREEIPGKTQDRDYVIRLAWGCLGRVSW